MKKYILLILSIIALNRLVKAQIYIGQKCNISFFSETKVENIDAVNKVAKPILDASTGKFAIKASQSAFTFKSALMQEHYNENYIESEKFPYVTFSGKINESIDYSVNGLYNVTIAGNIDMHGVSMPRVITGKIEIKDGKIFMNSIFDIKVADHKIKIPTLLMLKIAEIVRVTFYAELIKK